MLRLVARITGMIKNFDRGYWLLYTSINHFITLFVQLAL